MMRAVQTTTRCPAAGRVAARATPRGRWLQLGVVTLTGVLAAAG